MDSEEYGLWAAFMEPDSPPGSPALVPSAVDNQGSATAKAEEHEGRNGTEDRENRVFLRFFAVLVLKKI